MLCTPTPRFLEDHEEAAVARTLTGVRHNGVHYKMVGASGSAKNGKYYFCDAAHEPALAKRFEMWPEAAITYFGILVSCLKVIHQEADKRVFVVEDLKLGTNDCRGWIRRSLFLKLQQPEGYFYQFRLAFGNTQAKGSFKVMSDDVADALGCDIIVPESSIKPGLKRQSAVKSFFGTDVRTFRGPVVIGIREISRPLTFESSYTVLQHAPVDAIATEIVPQAREKIEALKTAWAQRNHEAIVAKIGSSVRNDDAEGEDFQRIIEATLLADGSGELTRHPYIHRQLDRLLARWAYKLMTGGGLDLPAFALADDGVLYLDNGKVRSAADWMPRDQAITSSTSDRSLCVRYRSAVRIEVTSRGHHFHVSACPCSTFAVEYERTLKTSARYQEIAKGIRDEDQVSAIMYLTPTPDLVFTLSAEFKRPELPMMFTASRRFRASGLATSVMFCYGTMRQSMSVQEALEVIAGVAE